MRGKENERAINRIETLNRIDEGLGRNCEVLLYMNWAAKAREEGDYEGALRIYAEHLFALSPPIARERLLFTLDSLASHAKESGDYTAAIELGERYGEKYSPLEAKAIVARMRENYGRELMKEGKYGRAKEVLAEYYEDLPNEKKLLLYECEYRRLASSLAADDYMGHYQLAQYCKDRGLLDEAEAELEKAMLSEDLRETAGKQLRLMQERRMLDEFAAGVLLYEQGYYGASLEAMLKFEEKYEKSDMTAEARRMVELSRGRLQSATQWRPYQAEVMYQQAERKFFGGDMKGAFRLLEDLEEKYADTPAGIRALKWKAEIVRKVEIAKLEGDEDVELDMSKVRMSYTPDNLEEELDKILESTGEKR
jgi:tetratricopeptide (TPR) repeat protein